MSANNVIKIDTFIAKFRYFTKQVNLRSTLLYKQHFKTGQLS